MPAMTVANVASRYAKAVASDATRLQAPLIG
jgi:hypothetical protein